MCETVLMSALPINADYTLLTIFRTITLSFLTVAATLCLFIVLRRMVHNRLKARRSLSKARFQDFLIKLINSDQPDANLDHSPACDIRDRTEIFVHYFQTLRGEKLKVLADMISASRVEADIIKATRHGVRGLRMRAVRTLSYLNTQASLQVIYESLFSVDKYVRLTAMRCLIRRRAACYLPDIIDSFIEAFPKDYKLLAGILADFGGDITQTLENLIVTSDDDTVVSACLEALCLLRPSATDLNFEALLHTQSETVRAAAVALSSITTHPGTPDILRLGLRDDAVSVKIRAAKMACELKRSDLTSDLYALTKDPVMWVQYWALKAIWVTGASGQKFVNALSQSDSMAADVSMEMRSGYV